MKYLVINKLTKSYGNNLIFQDLSLKLESDKVYFLTSENGSGKTTFLKCLLKETFYEGEIFDKNLKYVYLPERPLVPDYIRMNTFLNTFFLFEHKSVNEIVINHYLSEFEISRFKDSFIKNLSKGSKQKMMIVKTLLEEGDIYLFDEPLSGLDQKSRKKFMDFIYALNKEDKIIIIATHYYDDYYFTNKERIILR